MATYPVSIYQIEANKLFIFTYKILQKYSGPSDNPHNVWSFRQRDILKIKMLILPDGPPISDQEEQ